MKYSVERDWFHPSEISGKNTVKKFKISYTKRLAFYAFLGNRHGSFILPFSKKLKLGGEKLEKEIIYFEQIFKNWLNRGKGIGFKEHIKNVEFVMEKYKKELEKDNYISKDLRDKTQDLITQLNEALIEYN